MKITANDSIKLEGILKNPNEYIIALDKTNIEDSALDDKIYIAIKCDDKYVFQDILTKTNWVSYIELRNLLYRVQLEDLYAFKDYYGFIKWVSTKI